MGTRAKAAASLSQVAGASRAVILKPMASADRVSLFSRNITVGLSSAAIDILFEHASVLSEGSLDGTRYFGSTMVTLDLERAVALVTDDCDARTVVRMRDLLSKDVRVKQRALALGADEARRRAGVAVDEPQLDVRVSSTGCLLHLDLDIEAEAAKESS